MRKKTLKCRTHPSGGPRRRGEAKGAPGIAPKAHYPAHRPGALVYACVNPICLRCIPLLREGALVENSVELSLDEGSTSSLPAESKILMRLKAFTV